MDLVNLLVSVSLQHALTHPLDVTSAEVRYEVNKFCFPERNVYFAEKGLKLGIVYDEVHDFVHYLLDCFHATYFVVEAFWVVIVISTHYDVPLILDGFDEIFKHIMLDSRHFFQSFNGIAHQAVKVIISDPQFLMDVNDLSSYIEVAVPSQVLEIFSHFKNEFLLISLYKKSLDRLVSIALLKPFFTERL
jgi:hypothetical protein